LIRPASRGFVSLRSNNALDAPLIQPNYLQSAKDLDLMVNGTRLALELLATKAFEEFCGDHYHYAPNNKVSPDSTDTELAEFIRSHCETIYHPVGTCKMGADQMAVVDAELKVRGTENLRVADASVFPEAIGGNPNAVVIMIAEKAADLIKNARNNQ
jgi:choline dehydrogenase